MQHLDPHQRPPEKIKQVYKKYQKLKAKELDEDKDIIDLTNDASISSSDKVRVVDSLKGENVATAFRNFAGEVASKVPASIPVYEHVDMPGLHIIPTLLPPEIQLLLLDRLLHRDLSNPTHKTNIHTHYDLEYPPNSSSFFTLPPSFPKPLAHPLDPSIHNPLSAHQLLTRKLRWLTLGGQYDWTAKHYPSSIPPTFPPDIAALLHALFPHTVPQAAIVNLYSPGDTLSVHRDVAEECGRGLVSVSLGCEAVFVVGVDGERTDGEGDDGTEKVLAVRLRSGSAVYMSGASRVAWHGVPQVVRGTCPGYLKDWPGRKRDGDGEDTVDEFEAWRGWMEGKRVNVNVRQMRD